MEQGNAVAINAPTCLFSFEQSVDPHIQADKNGVTLTCFAGITVRLSPQVAFMVGLAVGIKFDVKEAGQKND